MAYGPGRFGVVLAKFTGGEHIRWTGRLVIDRDDSLV